MASKYSNYELKPYVSTYTNPYSVEVNTILRERYDQNKAKVDLIDQTLGAKQTLEGDRMHIDNAKSMVKTRFANLTAIGDYENAGLAVSEVVNMLESDRGLQLAQKSYSIREKELEMIREGKINGMNMLDFGKGRVDTHQSYYQDEDGAWVENVYEPLTEKEHLYSDAMQKLIKTIKADSSGVSQGKANRIARGLLPTYLDNYIGDQHFRKLTIIDGMSAQEAKSTILQELESITDQYVHHIQTGNKLNGSNSLYELFTGKGQTAGSYSFQMNGGETGNYLVDLNKQILFPNYEDLSDDQKLATEKLSRESFIMETNVVHGLFNDKSINQDEFNKHMQYGVNGYGQHSKLRNYVNHLTSNQIGSFDDVLQGEVPHSYNTIPAVGLTSAIALSRRLRGKKFGWRAALITGLVTYAGAETYSYLDRALDEQSNVRTTSSSIRGFLSGLGEEEQLIKNLENTSYLASRGIVHPVTGLEYNVNDPEYKALIEVAKANYAYRTELGGDKVYDLIESYAGDVFTGDVKRPSDTESGKKIRTILNSGETRFNAHNYDWLLIGDVNESGAFFDEESGAMLDGQKTGFLAGSFESGIPGYIEFQIGNKRNRHLANDKPSATGSGLTEVESGLLLLNDAPGAVHTHAFPILERMEKYSTSDIGETGGVTRADQVEVLAKSFKYIMNWVDGYNPVIDDENREGYAFAQQFMMQQFNNAHPGITMEIMNSLGYTGPNENVPKEILEQYNSIMNERYQKYLKLEIKRFNY